MPTDEERYLKDHEDASEILDAIMKKNRSISAVAITAQILSSAVICTQPSRELALKAAKCFVADLRQDIKAFYDEFPDGKVV